MASKGKQTHDGTALVDAPLPLVTLDNSGKFVVGTEATNLIRQIKGEIAVIAIAGIYRYVRYDCILMNLLSIAMHFFCGLVAVLEFTHSCASTCPICLFAFLLDSSSFSDTLKRLNEVELGGIQG